jgi:IS30 family transposase
MKMPNRKASTTYLHLQILINKIGLDKFKSITSDNGNEFALSNMIEQKTGIL